MTPILDQVLSSDAAGLDGMHALSERIVALCPTPLGPEQQVFLELALTEAIVNACKHAHRYDGRPVRVVAMCTPARLRVHVYDSGPGFDFGARATTPELMAESGRGLALICELMAGVSYGRTADGCNVLTFDLVLSH